MFESGADDLILEKLIILYILNSIDEDMTNAQITQIIMETKVMNYFTLLVLLPKMIEAKFITKYNKNNTELYAITQSGMEVLVYFQNRIPDFFIKKIDEYLEENKEEIFSSLIKKQSSYSMQGDSEYVVTLIVIKGGKNVMTMNINVDSEIEAKELCRKWNINYLDKYGKILKVLEEN